MIGFIGCVLTLAGYLLIIVNLFKYQDPDYDSFWSVLLFCCALILLGIICVSWQAYYDVGASL